MLQNTTKDVINSKILRFQRCDEAEDNPAMIIIATEIETGYCKVQW